MLGSKLTSIHIVNRIFNVKKNTQTFTSIDLPDKLMSPPSTIDSQELSELKLLLRENKLLRNRVITQASDISLWSPDTLLDIKSYLENLTGLICIKLGELDNVLIIYIDNTIGSEKCVYIVSINDCKKININAQLSYNEFFYLLQDLIIDSNKIMSFFTNTTEEHAKPIKKITIIPLS